MKIRILKTAVTIVLACSMMGCPAAGPISVSVGLWLFTITTPNVGTETAARTLLAGGQTENPVPKPPQASDEFSGTLTWMQNGSAYTMSQVISVNNELVYTGTVHSSTTMSGNWMRTAGGVLSGTWSAVKL